MFIKRFKDHLIKALLGEKAIPGGLFELSEYFRSYEPISFEFEKTSDGKIIARSTNFRYGSIITVAEDQQELDQHIKDAILTAFEIPGSYAEEAKIIKVGGQKREYALA